MPSQKFLEKKMRRSGAKQAERVSELKESIKPVILEAGIEKNTVSKGIQLSVTSIADGGRHDINLQKAHIGELQGNSTRLVIQNKTGLAIIPPRFAQEMFSMKLKTQDGTHQVCDMSTESMMYPLRFLDKDVLDRLKLGFESTADELANGIANGAIRTYYIPIYCPFVLNQCFMQSNDKQEITYEITFNAQAWAVGGAPELKTVDMISRHLYYSDKQMRKLKQHYENSVYSYRFRNFVIKNPTAVVGAGDKFEVDLDGLKNTQSSELILQLWKNGTLVSDFGNYIDTFDIELDNKSIISTSGIDSTYNDIVLGAAQEYQPVIGDVYDPWTVISFTTNNSADFVHGTVNGSYYFTGSEVLKIKVKDTLPDTGYTLRMYNGKIDQVNYVAGSFTA